MKKLGLIILCWIIFSPARPVTAEELANVNGAPITSEDYLKNMANLPPQMKNQFGSYDDKKRFLNMLIDREVLVQESRKEGADKDPVYLEEVEQAKKDLLVNMMAQKIAKEKATEENVRQYFNKNIKDFQLVRASHILVKTEEEAKKIKKELSAGGNFEELAKKYSLDTANAQRGGDLNFFNRKQMVQPFADMAFSLKVNEMGGPVKTQYGYHLIKVTEIKQPKFEELTQENQKTIRTGIVGSEIDKLKSKGKVTINEEALKKLN